VLAASYITGPVLAAEAAWTEIPRAHWKGATAVEVPALKRTAAAAIALPAEEGEPLVVTTAEPQAAGLYEVRLALRPSHTVGAIAFHAGLRAKADDTVAATFEGQFFARPEEPETRTFHVIKTGAGPLELTLEAYADAGVADSAWTKSMLKKGGPKLDSNPDLLGMSDEMGLDLALEVSLTPDTAVYYLVDKIEFRALSRSGLLAEVTTDKIRYRPGAVLKGTATVADVGGRGGRGRVDIYLEHGVKDRVKIKTLPVALARGTGVSPVAPTSGATHNTATGGTAVHDQARRPSSSRSPCPERNWATQWWPSTCLRTALIAAKRPSTSPSPRIFSGWRCSAAMRAAPAMSPLTRHRSARPWRRPGPNTTTRSSTSPGRWTTCSS